MGLQLDGKVKFLPDLRMKITTALFHLYGNLRNLRTSFLGILFPIAGIQETQDFLHLLWHSRLNVVRAG